MKRQRVKTKPAILELPMINLFREFFQSEKAGGIILIIFSLLSLILANSAMKEPWLGIWSQKVFNHSVTHWINDGLMAIFFLLIGLELEREIYCGQLSRLKTASMPFFAAIGGMLIPAIIFVAFNYGGETMAGTGIPMATDIAFALGILSLLGKRVPDSLKIFLTAFAILDDLGAILVIAIFYTKNLELYNLFIALGIYALLFLLNRLKIRNLLPYLAGGVIMWYFMLHSGIHATLAGVMLAFVIPFGSGSKRSPSYVLQHYLHFPVAFIILPVFAMANTALVFGSGWYQGLTGPLALGVILGLFVGKPLGITIFSMLGVAMKACSLPPGVQWKHVLGVGFLGGIGFTMSIFIAVLAFGDPAMIDQAKMAILAGSLVSGVTGYLFLFRSSGTHGVQTRQKKAKTIRR